MRNILLRFFGEFSSLRLAIARAVLPLLARRGREKFLRFLEELSEVERNYRSLVLSHVVIGAQSCVIAMSLGMVASFELYHYVSEDVRFGWSATRSLEDEEMHKIVQAVSLPWRFVEVGHPTLNQIADSRLNRDMSPHTVSKEASQAWASFLTMSILAYGLTLRLIILVFAARRSGKESKAPLLKGPPVEDLKLRMTTELQPTLIPPNRGLLPSTQNWWQIMRRGKK